MTVGRGRGNKRTGLQAMAALKKRGAKGKKKIHLNKQDRRKAIKLQKKQELMTDIKDKVKADLQRLETADDQSHSPSNSESSFGSVPLKRNKKRVSFAERVEQKEFEIKDQINAKASEASPGRSILTLKQKTRSKPSKLENGVNGEEGDTKMEEDFKDEKETKALHTINSGRVFKKKDPIQVTKKIKEQLLLMPRKERKAFIVELRKKQKPSFELIGQCKALWEEARMGKTSAERKDELIKQLVGLVKGHGKELIYTHEMSRIFQFLLKLNREGITSMLFDEVSSELIRMSKNIYARHFVNRMLKYGNQQQRQIIVESVKGHAVSMLGNVFSADILETIYNEYANAQQRFNIITEFYGQEFVVFRMDTIKTLGEIIAAEPAKKPLIMKHLEEIVLNKCTDKVTLRHSLVHKLLFDLMEYGTKEQKDSILEALKDKIPEIVHTPTGARVAMRCVWLADAKDRKLIVKNFQDLAVKAAKEKNGQRVLWAIFDQVDDTVLINKYITSEIANNVGTLLEDRWGCLCLEYMVHPRDGRSMDYNIIKELEMGDQNPHSKKEKKTRYAEIFRHLIGPLLTYFASNMEATLFGEMSALTAHIVHKALELPIARDLFNREVPADDRIQCYEEIAKLAAREFVPMDPKGYHLIESRNAGYVTGQFLRQDAKLPEEQRLCTQLVKHVPSEELGSWVGCNKGCFMLLRMWENGSEVVRQQVAESVDLKRLSKYTSAGARILHEALTGKKHKPEAPSTEEDDYEELDEESDDVEMDDDEQNEDEE